MFALLLSATPAPGSANASAQARTSRYPKRASTWGRRRSYCVSLRPTRLETHLCELPVLGNPGRVAAREAGSAELVLGPRRRGLGSVEREVSERRRPDLLAYLVDRARRGDELLLVREVDPVEARRHDRRGGDADVHLLRACFEEDCDDLPHRVAAHDRVVDEDEALSGDFRQRVELEADALLAETLV